MLFHNHVEREFLVDTPPETARSQQDVKDIWEVKSSQPRDTTFHILHWSYRSLPKYRYLRYFAR